jgi:hypothetical protein
MLAYFDSRSLVQSYTKSNQDIKAKKVGEFWWRLI